MDEANLETHDMRPFPGNAPDWYATVMDRITTMYARDKNHTSVLWWSFGNEVGSGDVFRDAADWVRATDPERLIHFQQDNSLSDIDGVFYPDLSLLERLAERGNNGKPWTTSEYSHAMGNSNGNFREYWELMDTAEWLQGGFIWEWADQSVRLPVDGGVQGLPIPEGTPEEDTYFSYGGDWGTYAHDGSFALNGLVNPDRDPHPALVEVAAVYAPVAVADQDLEASRVQLRNEFLATDLADVTLTYEVLRDGEVIDDGVIDVTAGPRESVWVDLPLEEPTEVPAGATHWLNIRAAAPESLSWAPADHEYALMQLELPWGAPERENLLEVSEAPESAETADSVTVTGEDFALVIDKTTGLIASFVADGAELLEQGPTPDFWRAPTLNDVRNALASRAEPWREAGGNVEVQDVTVRETDGSVHVQLTGTLPTPGAPLYRLGYHVTADGEVVVRSTMSGDNQLAELPAMGTALVLPGEYDNLAWLGRGPQENYNDRNFATTVGRWSSTVDEQLYPFPVPQATGNHTDVRWATLTNDAGSGLLVGGITDPIQFAALPYSEAQLTEATHQYQLEANGNVHLAVDGAQQGLGHQWGTPALPEYTLQSRDVHSFDFVLRPITAQDDVDEIARRTVELDLLAGITVDAVPLAGFDTDVTRYTLTYSGALEGEVPVIEAAPAADDVTVTVTQAEDVPGTATITATSADGVVTSTYEVELVVVDELYLSDINWVSATNGYGTIGRDVTIGGTVINLMTVDGPAVQPKGLGVHANASLVYDVSDWDFNRFSTLVGVEQSAGRNDREFRFQVLLDGEVAWTSGSMNRNTPAAQVDLDVEGVETIRLDMTFLGANNGHGHGAWGVPRLWNEAGEPGTAPTSLAVSPAEVTLPLGEQVALAVAVTPAEADDSVTWTSSDPEVATVTDDGVVRTLAAGVATITATSTLDETVRADSVVTVTATPPTALAVSPDPVVLPAGAQVPLTVTAAPEGAATLVEWTSSDTSVLRVSEEGVVTGVEPGTGTVTARSVLDAGVTAVVPVQVTGPAPSSVSVTPGTATVTPGATVALTATAAPATAEQAVTWTTSDTALATVSSTGVVTGVAPGSATITATSIADPSRRATATVTVERPAPTAITLAPERTSLEEGGTVTLGASVVPAAADQAVTWSTSDSAVATVDSYGLVTGVAAGEATVTATSVAAPGVSATASVTVVATAPPLPQQVVVDPQAVDLEIGATATLTAGVTPVAAVQAVTWSSSDEAVATVDAAGVVTALAAGTATVTAAAQADDSVTGSATVTVAPAPAPEFSDVEADTLFAEDIAWLAEQGVATGWELPDGTWEYRPLAPVARDAMAAFLFRMAGDSEYVAPLVSPFVDVPADNQFYREIAWLAQEGVATGWELPDGTREFRPLSSINRDAMAAFLYRLADVEGHEPPAVSPFLDVAPATQFYAEITWAAQVGVTTGWEGNDGTAVFRPVTPIARDAMAAFLHRFSDHLG